MMTNDAAREISVTENGKIFKKSFAGVFVLFDECIVRNYSKFPIGPNKEEHLN